jgi:hypothetical protein
MSLYSPYRCDLIESDGRTRASVELPASTDADAILLGNSLERDHPEYAGIEIREGDRLIYRHTSE